jgi:drug/metabolite transporter (DMT)-like permease
VGISALLMASISMWTALLEWVRGAPSRPGKLVITSLLAGFGGVTALVIHPQTLAGSDQGALGAVVLLIGAFSWASGTVLTRRMPLTSSTVVNSGMQMLTGGGLLLLLGAASGRIPDPAAITAPSVAAMLFLTFVGSLVGFTSYLWLLGKVPATQVATYAYVNPIVAVFLGWALAGEQLRQGPWQPAGSRGYDRYRPQAAGGCVREVEEAEYPAEFVGEAGVLAKR